MGHLPIDNKLLRDMSFLHPLLRDSKHGSQAFHRLAVMMLTISDEEISFVTAEWKVYQTGQVDSGSATRRVYHCWADVFQEKIARVKSSILFFRQGLSKVMERNGCYGNGGGHSLCQLFVLLS